MKNIFKIRIAIFAFFVLLVNVFDQSYANVEPACGKPGLSIGRNGIKPNGGTIIVDKTGDGCEQNGVPVTTGGTKETDGTRVTGTRVTGTQCGCSTPTPPPSPVKKPPQPGCGCNKNEGTGTTGGKDCNCDKNGGTGGTGGKGQECDGKNYPAGGFIGKMLSAL